MVSSVSPTERLLSLPKLPIILPPARPPYNCMEAAIGFPPSIGDISFPMALSGEDIAIALIERAMGFSLIPIDLNNILLAAPDLCSCIKCWDLCRCMRESYVLCPSSLEGIRFSPNIIPIIIFIIGLPKSFPMCEYDVLASLGSNVLTSAIYLSCCCTAAFLKSSFHSAISFFKSSGLCFLSFILAFGEAEGNFNSIMEVAVSNIGFSVSFVLLGRLLRSEVSISNLFCSSPIMCCSSIYSITNSSRKREPRLG